MELLSYPKSSYLCDECKNDVVHVNNMKIHKFFSLNRNNSNKQKPECTCTESVARGIEKVDLQRALCGM